MPLDWNMINLVWIKVILTNIADFIHTLFFPDGFTAGSVKSNFMLRMTSFGGWCETLREFLPFRYWCFLTFILTQSLPHSFFIVCCLLWGFPLLLPAPVCDGLTWWLLTAINPPDRGTSVMLPTSGGRCWWHVLLCHHSWFPSCRERGGGRKCPLSVPWPSWCQSGKVTGG